MVCAVARVEVGSGTAALSASPHAASSAPPGRQGDEDGESAARGARGVSGELKRGSGGVSVAKRAEDELCEVEDACVSPVWSAEHAAAGVGVGAGRDQMWRGGGPVDTPEEAAEASDARTARMVAPSSEGRGGGGAAGAAAPAGSATSAVRGGGA